MVENKTTYLPMDQSPEHKENISNQDAIRPHRGSIESMIVNYHQYPEERKQQHIEWLLKHNTSYK